MFYLKQNSRWRQKVLVQVKSFRGPFSSCVQQKEDSGYKRRKCTKNERQENPVVFKSSSIYVQEHNVELTSPTMHQREGGNHGQVVQEGFQDFPWEGNNPEGSCTCATANTAADVCDATAGQLPNGSNLFCDVNPIGSFHESNLFHRAMQAPKQMQLLQVSWTGATLKPKNMCKNKGKGYFSLNKNHCGVTLVLFLPEQRRNTLKESFKLNCLLACKGQVPTSMLQPRASSPERCKMSSTDHKWGRPGLYQPDSSGSSGTEECCV